MRRHNTRELLSPWLSCPATLPWRDTLTRAVNMRVRLVAALLNASRQPSHPVFLIVWTAGEHEQLSSAVGIVVQLARSYDVFLFVQMFLMYLYTTSWKSKRSRYWQTRSDYRSMANEGYSRRHSRAGGGLNMCQSCREQISHVVGMW